MFHLDVHIVALLTTIGFLGAVVTLWVVCGNRANTLGG